MDLDCADDMSVNPLYTNNAEDARKIRKRIRLSGFTNQCKED